MSKENYKKVYQFKITLMGIKPPIWRRIQVPDNYTFWDLHVAVQDAMGWTDSHLHGFYLKDPRGFGEIMIGIPDDEYLDDTTLPGWKLKIKSWFPKLITKTRYEYDFGDGWEHKIELEKILPREAAVEYPLCVKGKRACPPEDCGGTYGYERLLEIIADPKDEEHEDMLEWLGLDRGEDLDPAEFSCDDVFFDDPKERLRYAFE